MFVIFFSCVNVIHCCSLRFLNDEAVDEELTILQKRILIEIARVIMFRGLLRVLLIVI